MAASRAGRHQPGFVIGLSSPTGGGKTTVAGKVAELLGRATRLSFDDYDDFTIHPADYRSWLAAGADYNAWQTTRLAEDLARLKQGQSIVSPLDGRTIAAVAFIIFDAPLGRANWQTGQYIDWLVYLDTPLDVALARRILRDFYGAGSALTAEQAGRLRVDLETYLDFSRAAYLEMDRQVKPGSDLVLDGTLPPDELARQIVEAVNSRVGS